MSKQLVVTATGFPGTNKTLRFLQSGFREPLEALAKMAGDKTILTGVVVDNSNPSNVTVSDGYIVYNGEIMKFQGGNFENTVTIIEQVENVNYNTDANNDTVLDNLPAYKDTYARCGTGGIAIFNFSELKRLKTINELSQFELPNGIVIDTNYVHTDVNFTLALLNKLNGIEAGAEVNVQSDWNMTAPSSDAFILNKPFNGLAFTHGSTITYNRTPTGANQFNFSYNNAFIYPPSGYTINNLVGFVPSIGEISFWGDVDNNDYLWCNYQVQYANNRVAVTCNNSENGQRSIINYLAIWRK